jgi:hypothetical protein
MSQPPRPVARHVPTLTEVIEVQAHALPTPEVDVPVEMSPQVPALSDVEVPALSEADPDLSVQKQVPTQAPTPAFTEVDRAVIPRSMLSEAGFQAAVAAMPGVAASSFAPPSPASSTVAAPVMLAIDEQAIVQKVHADLQRQIDGMLEYRLREAIGPILARTSELLVRELRQELGKTMKDVVARSVAQEVARQRSRSGS